MHAQTPALFAMVKRKGISKTGRRAAAAAASQAGLALDIASTFQLPPSNNEAIDHIEAIEATRLPAITPAPSYSRASAGRRPLGSGTRTTRQTPRSPTPAASVCTYFPKNRWLVSVTKE